MRLIAFLILEYCEIMCSFIFAFIFVRDLFALSVHAIKHVFRGNNFISTINLKQSVDCNIKSSDSLLSFYRFDFFFSFLSFL